MSSTITLAGDWLLSLGNKRGSQGTGNLGVYATNGVAVTAAQVGLGVLDELIVSPAAGYVFAFDKTNGKVLAYRSAALSPAGTISGTAAGQVFTGESYTPAGSVSTGQGINYFSVGGGDIKGSANTNSENTDQGALPTNGLLIDTGHAVAAGAWTFTKAVNPDVGRNLMITVKNDSGGPLNLFEGVMSFALTGTWRGAAQTETITFTSTAGNKALATANYRYKYGTKPFDTITTVVITNVPDNDLKLGVGIGSLLGLPTDLLTPLEADVIKITKNAADLSPSGLVDTTNMTVNLGALADGDDVAIEYKQTLTAGTFTGTPHTLAGTNASSTVTATFSGSAIAQAALAEVTNSTNLAGVTFRFMAVGY